MLSVKQGGIKYHFLSLWYDSTWVWTPVSQTIGEHFNHNANGPVSISRYPLWKLANNTKILQNFWLKYFYLFIFIFCLKALMLLLDTDMKITLTCRVNCVGGQLEGACSRTLCGWHSRRQHVHVQRDGGRLEEMWPREFARASGTFHYRNIFNPRITNKKGRKVSLKKFNVAPMCGCKLSHLRFSLSLSLSLSLSYYFYLTLSPTISFSLFHSLSLCFSFSLSLSLILSLTLSPTISLSLSLFLPLPFSLSHYLSLSLSPFLSLTLSPTISLFCFYRFLFLPLSISSFLSLPLSPTISLTLSLSFYLILSLFLSLPFSLSFSFSLFLSLLIRTFQVIKGKEKKQIIYSYESALLSLTTL